MSRQADTSPSPHRRAGLLLHPSSLPGGHGVGDLGAEAYALLNWLHAAGMTIWQILPLGPVDAGGSPYTSRSALAGNLALVDLRGLVVAGLLSTTDLRAAPANNRAVDWPLVSGWKSARVLQAADALLQERNHPFYEPMRAWIEAERGWLDDVACYEALRAAHGDVPWTHWPASARDRDPDVLAALREQHAWWRQAAAQYLFARQWAALRVAAGQLGIGLVGDAPIYVAHDSADVWAHRALFQLDAAGDPLAVAGVPPDAFSDLGQLWGNPLYDWPAHQAQDFDWWRRRMRRLAAVVDAVRIDHFRGLAAYWAVPRDADDARAGRWCPGPGAALLQAIAWEGLELWAEDLGIIDDDVVALRDGAELPGMAILQFAWDGDPDNAYLPHHQLRRQVVYTGTHDNDTTLGWWQSGGDVQRHRVRVYFGIDGHDPVWSMIRAALASVANVAVIPVQDVLALPTAARMNTPGLVQGNWAFRLLPGELGVGHAERMRRLCELYGRLRPLARDLEFDPPADATDGDDGAHA